MGAGIHGGFGNTYGSVAFGSTDYTKANDKFGIFISKRKDIDTNGFYDVIAHGNEVSIEIQNNGKTISIDHRTAAKLLSKEKNTKNKEFACYHVVRES